MALKLFNPDENYLLEHLDETHILAESISILREAYNENKLNESTVDILGTKVLADHAYQLAMYRLNQGYYYAAGSILECLEKVKYPQAFLAMADLCRKGLGVEVDMEQADKLEKKAFNIWNDKASAGDAQALFEIGVCYRHGECVPQDDATAVDYYTRAYENGYCDAALNLGLMYENGLGVDKDLAKAYELYNVAAGNGVADGYTLMGRQHYYGLGRDVNYKKAVELFLKAAEQEEGDALYHLGCCYVNGNGVEKDNDKAIDYFYRSADAGTKGAVEVLQSNGLPYPLEDNIEEE